MRVLLNRCVLFALLGAGAMSCVHPRAEATRYAHRYQDACKRLEAEPRSLLEKMVAQPDDFPYEVWKREHPEAPSGSLYKREIKAVIEASLHRVRACYEDALRGWPNAQGRVVVRFGINSSGRVEAATIVANETGVRPLACCITDVAGSWFFRAPDGGGPVVVTYPFDLKQGP